MISTIEHTESEIIEEFALLGDWMEKYAYIIDLGRSLAPLDDRYKTDVFRVRGCQSQVWLHADVEDDVLVFSADSDAAITKGLIALLLRVLNRQPAACIVNARLRFIEEIGLRTHLSPNRSNGLAAMVKRIQDFARAHSRPVDFQPSIRHTT